MKPSQEFDQALLAWQFLTRVPLPRVLAARVDATAVGSDAPVVSVRHFATVGLAIGAIAAMVWAVAALIWPPLVAVLAAVGTTIWLTGAFHEDGLADTCDGLIGHVSRERAFAIMRDSRIGTYGACGLWVVLTARVVLLAALPPAFVPWAFIIGQGISRAASMTMMAGLPYVADPGSSKLVSRMQAAGAGDLAIGWSAVAIATALAMGTTTATTDASAPAAWLAAVAAVLAGLWGLARWFTARIGGYTGDCLGATQQLTELLCLAGLVAVAGSAAAAR